MTSLTRNDTHQAVSRALLADGHQRAGSGVNAPGFTVRKSAHMVLVAAAGLHAKADLAEYADTLTRARFTVEPDPFDKLALVVTRH